MMKGLSTFWQASTLSPGKHFALDDFGHYDSRK